MDRANRGPRGRTVTGSDFLQLSAVDVPAGRLASWLAGELRAAIADGRLPVGGRLPATRTFAADLRVSRGVVTEAYRRLVEDGHIAGNGRGGTTVVAAPARPAATGATAVRRAVFADPDAPDVFDVLRATPARIDLSPGLPDLAAFPRAAWLRAERDVLGSLQPADFGYGDPRGAPALRLAVAGWLARYRGIRAEPDDVIVTAGVSQGLGLLAQVLPDRRLAVEDPGSLGVRQHLAAWGVTCEPVPVDAEGLRVDALGDVLAVLVTPAHQFPTGVVLSGARRRALLAWCEPTHAVQSRGWSPRLHRMGGPIAADGRERPMVADGPGRLIVEDDYDAEHRYDRPPVPALRSLAPDRVAYLGSVSKTLAPALRIGWLLAPDRYRAAVVEARRNADLGNAVLAQLVLARLMDSGELERHLRLVRRRHRTRRDAMVAAVRRHLPDATVHGAAAGLHLLVTLPDGTDDVALATAALDHGVKTQPLSWHRVRPGAPGLLLGYAATPPTGIAEGVEILGVLSRGRRRT